jgi:hypothetical protein
MKNLVKLVGIITLVAVIGFSMTACDDDSSNFSHSNITVKEKAFNAEANNFLTNPDRDPAITFKRLSINNEIEFIVAYGPEKSKKPLFINIHSGLGRKEQELGNLDWQAHEGFFSIALDVAANGESNKGPLLNMDAWMETVGYIDTLIEYCRDVRHDVNANNFAIGGWSMGGTVTLLYGVYGKYRPKVLSPEISSPDFTKVLNGRANAIMDKGRDAGRASSESVMEKAVELSPLNHLEKFYDLPMYARFGEKDYENGAEGAIAFVNNLRNAGQTVQRLYIIENGLHGQMPDGSPFPEPEPKMSYIKNYMGL